MRHDAIERYMSHDVHTIAHDRTLAEASQLMSSLRIRHLPVLDGGKLVGIVTHRDLALVETLKDIDPTRVRVFDAMSDEVFAISPEAPVAEVAHAMARDRLGSALVVHDGKVVGIFTAVDALRTLDFLLSSPAIRQALPEAMVGAPTAAES